MIKVERNGKTFDLYRAEHMIHHENFESVLKHGLLSHNEAHKRGLVSEDISMEEVQRWRRNKTVDVVTANDGKKMSFDVHDFVPFYFNSRNPMMYKRKSLCDEMLILIVDIDILKEPNTKTGFTAFSDGNMGASKTRYSLNTDDLSKLDLNLILGGSWNSDDEDIKRENRRKMCAEILVYPRVGIDKIVKVICPNSEMHRFTSSCVKSTPKASHIDVETQNGYFFF